MTKLDVLYKLLDELEHNKKEREAAALRWAIYHLEQQHIED